MSEPKFPVLVVASDRGAGQMLALRLNKHPRLEATVVEGIAAAETYLAAGNAVAFILIDGFFARPYGYGAGSPSALFIDVTVKPRGLKFGRYLSIPSGVPDGYTGDVPMTTKPPAAQKGDGDDLEDQIVALLSV